MSTLNVSNITDGVDTVETGYVVNGSAKAWVNLNGTGTIAARDSFNVASLTDSGTGIYRVNYTSAMSNGNYSTISAVAQYTPFPIAQAYIGTTASTYQILNNAQPGTADYDTNTVNASMFGDLA